MKTRCARATLLATTACGAVALLAPGAASAQSANQASTAAQVQEVVVTGSRIRQSTDTTSPAPVAIVNAQVIEDKGFLQVGNALNEMTSNAPARTATPNLANGQALPGQDFPNLFNLGPARTLSLFNGRRMVSTSAGLGDEAVDTNIIPTGLLRRIDVVQGGGGAVYGSGAIAGVVNYVMKDDYQGLSVQAQHGWDSRKSYKAQVARITAGTNFAAGRGNIAAEFNYSENSSLLARDRPGRAGGTLLSIPNTVPGAGTNGIPRNIYPDGPVNIYEDINGLVVTNQTGATAAAVVQTNNRGFTINSDGNIELKSLGTPVVGNTTQNLNAEIFYPIPGVNTIYATGVKRYIGNVISHYDITDHIKVRGEFLAAKVEATAPKVNTVVDQFLGSFTATYPGLAPLPFDRNNPYLTAQAVAQLSAVNPAFAAGQPLYLTKTFVNIPSKYTDQRFDTLTFRGLLSLQGDFKVAGRNFFWETAYSHGQVETKVDAYNIIMSNMRRAAAAVRNNAGQIVCAVNATVVTDPGCIPLNIFGTAPLPANALAYIMGRSGVGAAPAGQRSPVLNMQDDLIASISGDVVELPAGTARFSLAYEHRAQKSKFKPLPEDLVPQYFTGIAAVAGSGEYSTNEYAAELSVPLLGRDLTLPFVEALQVDGSYRYVENTLAGNNSVWGTGLRWTVGHGLVLRGTFSRNFRAPSLNQVLAPPVVSIAGPANPCALTNIGGGTAPSVRATNCLALFTANPTFGLATLPAGVANTPANRLATFTQTVTSSVITTTQGNPDLKNEVAETMTLGFVYQPRFIPRLTISADMLNLRLTNAITLYSTANYAATCMDGTPQPAALCSTLGYDAQGNYIRGIQSTVNAGSSSLHAQTVTVDYRLPLDDLGTPLRGALDLTVQATHNSYQQTTFAGTATRTDGTQTLPTWVARFDAHYSYGPMRVNYSLNYLPKSLINFTATVANSNGGIYKLARNYRQDVSVDYKFADRYVVRVGVNNLFDEMPSFPTYTYGDVIGRNFFVSLKADL